MQEATFAAASMRPPTELTEYCTVLKETVPLPPGATVTAEIDRADWEDNDNDGTGSGEEVAVPDEPTQTAGPSTRAARRQRRAIAIEPPVVAEGSSEEEPQVEEDATEDDEFHFHSAKASVVQAQVETGPEQTPLNDLSNVQVLMSYTIF